MRIITFHRKGNLISLAVSILVFPQMTDMGISKVVTIAGWTKKQDIQNQHLVLVRS
jgi:hypothetical protein